MQHDSDAERGNVSEVTRLQVCEAIVKSESGKLAKAAYAGWAWKHQQNGRAMEEMGVDEMTYLKMAEAHRQLMREDSDRGRMYQSAFARLCIGFPSPKEMDQAVNAGTKLEQI